MEYENALPNAGGLLLEHSSEADLNPNYNVSPTQSSWIARHDGQHVLLERTQWGLLARWAKEPSKGLRPINARAETVATSNMFSPLVKKRRCLVPCDGFYEWQQSPSGKHPYLIRLKSDVPFFFAGLYDTWNEGESDALSTFTIITGEPNKVVAPIHNRMPTIIEPKDYKRWLDPGVTEPAAIADIFKIYPASEMTAYRVSRSVNSPKNNKPELLQAVEGA